MKRTFRLLTIVLILITLVVGMTAIAVYAAGGTPIYFVPNSNWKSDNAEFAMYVWIDGGDHQWIDLTDSDGDGIFEGVLPSGYTNLIFCRMNPNRDKNGWSEGRTWNQSADLTYDGSKNLYTIADGAWSKGNGSWSVFDDSICAHSYGKDFICTKCGNELIYTIAGNVMKRSDGTYAKGDNNTIFVSKWDPADENNKMEFDSESECFVKIYENVAAGEYHFKVAENKSWDVSYGQDGGNCYLKVEQDGSTVLISFRDGKVTSAVAVPQKPVEPDEPTTPNEPNDKDEDSTTPDDPNTPGESTDSNEPDNSPGDSDKGEESEENKPEHKLNFFQRLWKAIANFFRKLFKVKN